MSSLDLYRKLSNLFHQQQQSIVAIELQSEDCNWFDREPITQIISACQGLSVGELSNLIPGCLEIALKQPDSNFMVIVLGVTNNKWNRSMWLKVVLQ